jgi:predicted component of type VI protein secretion system
VLELVELHVEVLPDRTHPRVAHERHSVSPTVFSCLKRYENRIMRHEVRHVKP